jgi:hypothetical protein
MKKVNLAWVACATLMLACGAAQAASVKFVKKENAGGGIGNFKYTYSYTCNKGKTGTVVVTTANDNQAKSLAEMEANEKCGD